jgi:hypothetical protein
MYTVKIMTLKDHLYEETADQMWSTAEIEKGSFNLV